MFLFRARVSFISKVRGVSVLFSFISLLSNCQKSMCRSFPKGLGELSCCQSVAFNIGVSFLSKEWVTGGFCGVRLS